MSSELKHVRQVWEHLGATNPYWSVLTEDDFHGGDARAEFFQSGRDDVRELLGILDRHGLAYGSRAIDFGCGVGRLSFALAEQVTEVTGVDVAASMIELAEAANPYPDRVHFVHNDADTLPFADDSADLLVSLITLQHMPPSLSLRYLLEMARVTRPGGHLIFQLPSHYPRPAALPAGLCRAELKVLDGAAELGVNEARELRVAVRNISDGPWPAGQLVNLANHWYLDDTLITWDDGRTTIPGPLAPGQSVELMVQVTAPASSGSYEVEFDVVQEHVSWWAELGNRPTRSTVEVQPESQPNSAAATSEQEAQPTEDSSSKTMEMYGVHWRLVCALFEHIDCKVVEKLSDHRAGSNWSNFIYAIEVGGHSNPESTATDAARQKILT